MALYKLDYYYYYEYYYYFLSPQTQSRRQKILQKSKITTASRQRLFYGLFYVIIIVIMLQVAEWTKAISVKWRELTAEQKETFQKMAANDKQRYMQQVNPLKFCVTVGVPTLNKLQQCFIVVSPTNTCQTVNIKLICRTLMIEFLHLRKVFSWIYAGTPPTFSFFLFLH